MHTLVLIPAFGCDHRLYDEVAEALSPVINPVVLVADRDSFAGCVAQILASAPDKFTVLGTSFGGRCALELTLAAPERVQGLVVIGSGAGPVADKAAGLRRSTRLRAGEMENVLAEMGDMVSHLPGPNGPHARDLFIAMGRDMGAERMARQSDALAGRVDLKPQLKDIACPALMLWGVHDKFSPAADGLAMSSAMPRGRYAEIEGCGHFPTLEFPPETAAIIQHWLADNRLI